MSDLHDAWSGFEVTEEELAGNLLWLAVYHDAARREPEDSLYRIIRNTEECLRYAARRGITKEKVMQELNMITERWLDWRFGVLRLGQTFCDETSSPSGEEVEDSCDA